MSIDTDKQTIGLERRVKELEQELAEGTRQCEEGRRSDKRFRRIFEFSNDAIFLVDPEAGAILDCNRKACELLGYSREELLRLPLSAIHPYEPLRLRTFLQTVQEKGQGWTNELACVTRSGASVSTEISASVVELEGRTTLIAIVRDISERQRLNRERQYLKSEIWARAGFGAIIGRSAALMNVLQQIEMVSATDTTVLITGESGTGKELVAQAIHERSPRKDHTLVRVNCAAVPAELFESEFFGHAKGAFTGAQEDVSGRFELADRGTLLLDEIGEVPLPLQSKLLRVLEAHQFERVGESRTRTVDVRIVAASNTNLLQAVEEGRFREDLYYRLNVFPIHIPPLRERREDIAPLAEHFVELLSERLHRPKPRLTPVQLDALQEYQWPGNVRELQNVIERALIRSFGGPLQLDLGERGTRPAGKDAPALDGLPTVKKLDDLKRHERDLIIRTIEETGGRIYGPKGAAARLGVPPTTLASKIKKLHTQRGDG